jgi:ADP-ribosyl-[dinitrogen reductase] hydrolase
MTSDKFIGSVIGLCLGDALGAPHEFRYQKVQYTGKLEHEILFRTRYQPPKRFPIGTVTDDTEMTIALLRSIVENNDYHPEKVALEYMKWAKTSVFMGRNTRDLFKNVKTVRGYSARYEKKFEIKAFGGELTKIEKQPESNGSLMRCVPLILVDSKYWITDCCMTNPTRVSVDCNLVYLSAVKLLISGELSDKVYDYVKKISENKSVLNVFDQVDNKTPRDITILKGHVLHGLYCAMMTLKYFNNYSELIDWVIRLGGDTDTNACIAGGLMGAKLGYQNMIREGVTADNISILKTNPKVIELLGLVMGT